MPSVPFKEKKKKSGEQGKTRGRKRANEGVKKGKGGPKKEKEGVREGEGGVKQVFSATTLRKAKGGCFTGCCLKAP